MSMERATPLEQVQIVPLMLHAQGQVGCLVECGHRSATKRGLLLTPSTSFRNLCRIQYSCIFYRGMKNWSHAFMASVIPASFIASQRSSFET